MCKCLHNYFYKKCNFYVEKHIFSVHFVPFDVENIVISFSGGKDSTVTADLVVKALSDPLVLESYCHIDEITNICYNK